MTEDAATDKAESSFDEARVAKGVALGIPIATISLAVVVGVVLGFPQAVLVVAAGVLLGVIALFWASLRVLSGDAPLPPELEALDGSGHAVDALASRKKMLLRAIKDLDNEHALGKLEDDDYHQISETYRSELKTVMKEIDASLEPFREKAEAEARAFLEGRGIEGGAERGAETTPDVDSGAKAKKKTLRVSCEKCSTSNEPDAAFCKKCGATLAGPGASKPDEGEKSTEAGSGGESEESPSAGEEVAKGKGARDEVAR